MSTFFTADTHFGHPGIIYYCHRPFKSIEEMNEIIINNWNNKVGTSDTTYILGDFALKISIQKIKKLLNILNGKKYFIIGDHDKQIWKCKDLLEEITPLKKISIGDISITLCHYSLRVWWKSHYNAWHCFGHSHGFLPSIGKSHDVGVDNNNFTPVSFDELKIIMNGKEDNFNYIKKRKR